MQKTDSHFYQLRHIIFNESYKEYEEQQIDIGKIIKELLFDYGFDPKEKGTLYLADLIETIFHERELFEINEEFFNLNDVTNPHYSFVNEAFECGIKNLFTELDNVISKSALVNQSMNQIVYPIVDDLVLQFSRKRAEKRFMLALN